MLDFANYAVLICSGLAFVAGVAVYVLSQAAEREKERALERYKEEAALKVAGANERAEAATAQAASAQADAERAKLEVARTTERLLHTQARLDSANAVTPFSQDQLDHIVAELIKVDFGGAQPVWGAVNDRQAQWRLSQLAAAVSKADRHLYPHPTTGSVVPPPGERGDILIHYWNRKFAPVAERIAEVFRGAGLEASTYKLPPEPNEAAQQAAESLVLVAIAARPTPTFQDR